MTGKLVGFKAVVGVFSLGGRCINYWPIPGPRRDLYRLLLSVWELSGEPLRHAEVPLHREHMRSPAHSLSNVVWQRRHWRVLLTPGEGFLAGSSVDVELDINPPLRDRMVG